MSVDHYENFPVASLLCPPQLRPAVRAIYRFARTADDIADEGNATSDERLADLAAYRADLEQIGRGERPSGRWPEVFGALADVMAGYRLPLPLLADLLCAFEQDVTGHRYADRAQLLDYCGRSANPVGRLLLHLYGISDRVSLQQSDAICSALQLANFWQDLRIDTERGRLYVPLADCERFDVEPASLLERREDRNTRRLVAAMVAWARALMQEGAPLALRVPGRAGWELRLVVQGGLAILDKIGGSDFAALERRATLTAFDVPSLLWRAATMRGPSRIESGERA